MGEDIPDHLQGQSLLPAVRNPTDFEPRPVFVEWLGVGTGAGNSLTATPPPDWLQTLPETLEQIRTSCSAQVRTVISPDQWKFNCASNGEHELYNLRQDPGERQNLIQQSGTDAVRERLRALIGAWQQRTGDTLVLPD